MRYRGDIGSTSLSTSKLVKPYTPLSIVGSIVDARLFTMDAFIIQSSLLLSLFHLSRQESIISKPTAMHGLTVTNYHNCSSYSVSSSYCCDCLEYLDRKCILCCTFENGQCCYPHKCNSCLDDPWGYMTLMQISISLAIFVVVGFVVISLFKLLNKYFNLRTAVQASTASVLRCPCSGPCCCSCILQNRPRPPRYNEIHEAPPIYNSTTSAQTTSYEPPPTYSSGMLETSTVLSVESLYSNSNHVSTHRQNDNIPVISHI